MTVMFYNRDVNAAVLGTVYKCTMLQNKTKPKQPKKPQLNKNPATSLNVPTQNRLLLVVQDVSSGSRIPQSHLLLFHYPRVQARIVPKQGYKAACTKWKMIKRAEMDALPNQ